MSLVYRSTELRNLTTARYWFDLPLGLTGILTVRGKDVVIPKSSGQYPGNRKAHQRIIPVHGLLLGTSESNHYAGRVALDAIFDPTLDAGDLVVTGDWIGLGATSKTISVRCMDDIRIVEKVPNLVTEYDVQLLCITSPPNWT